MATTPSPWKVIDLRKAPLPQEQIAIASQSAHKAGKPFGVCRIENTVNKGRPLTDEDTANAYLLAAAPELLKELEDAVKIAAASDVSPDIIARYNSVIAKAKGL